MEVTRAPPPDLIVVRISLPETGIEGQVIDVEWTVRNNGLADATGPWTDRVYLRKVGDTGAGTLIGPYSYAGPLEAGKTYPRKVETRRPSKTSDRYELSVVTDTGKTVYENLRPANGRKSVG